MKNFGELARGFVNRVAERLREPQQPASAPNASSWPLRRNASSSAAAPTADVQQALSESAALPLAVRIGQFKDKLFANPIDLDALRKLAMHGIPDKDGLRAITWKLLLHYLPTDPGLWEQELADKRERYRAFCQELIIDPKAKDGTSSGSVSEAHTAAASAAAGEASSGSMPPASPSRQPLSSQDVTGEDHPLSLGPASRWAAYFQDSEVLAQIQRDVVRTHPSMHFFSGDGPAAEAHRADMTRALFIYAKLNPGLRYIQGMNELFSMLYYAEVHAEADAFWCFTDLLSEARDHFCAQLDNSALGIRATIRRLMGLLQAQDHRLWQHIEVANKVDPVLYAFRWITLLLVQEFDFPDAARIWDTLLADPAGRENCLLRVCAAMILLQRDTLLAEDFTGIMRTLQRYPATDVNAILCKAMDLQKL